MLLNNRKEKMVCAHHVIVLCYIAELHVSVLASLKKIYMKHSTPSMPN